MNKLSPGQAKVFDYVKRFISTNNYPPTRNEISRALGFSSANAAEEHLKALAKKGAIELVPAISRGIRLCDKSTGSL